MDKKELIKRLEKIEKMLENHNQDVLELTFVRDGLKEQVSNLKK